MAREKTEFQVDREAHRMRLDRYITFQCPHLNRRAVDRLLRGGNVLVGGKPRDRRYFVKQGQQISLLISPTTGRIDNAINYRLDGVATGAADGFAVDGAIANQAADSPTVLFHTPDLIALNKPPGMITAANKRRESAATPETDLLTWLTDWLAQRSLDGVRPGVLHRLDKETSGVILFSLSASAHRLLLAAWRRRAIRKSYLGLVGGSIQPQEGRIELALGTNRSGRMVPDPDGRPAITDYRVLRRLEGCSLVECFPITGRTHQIRIHLRAVNHPLLGDPIYGAATAGIDPRPPRLWLHAWRLGLPKRLAAQLDWPLEIEAPLWPDLAAHLSALGGKTRDL